jgi:23S rRNA-/tRNA-specific pseudouridylate synthase
MGLHALRLSVLHPSRGEPIRFEAPPPPDFQALTR